MKIGVVGLGYVGSVTAAVLADRGNQVVGFDVDDKKVEYLSNCDAVFHEAGLLEILKRTTETLKFTTNIQRLSESEIVFITVQTPNKNGKIDLKYLIKAVDSVSKINKKCIIVLKSTVIPGTARMVSERTQMEVVSNPEFTREGLAISDTIFPDRVILGGRPEVANSVKKLWEFTNSPILITNWENAEMIKYASNLFLATKISFINEMSDLCEKIHGADIEEVARGMGFDRRIGKDFLKAGLGYGGSCLSKDTEAIMDFAFKKGAELTIALAASKVNENRINHAIDLIKSETKNPLSSSAIGIMGLSFKDHTDDIRSSQSIKLVQKLIPLAGRINLYDPVVKINIKGAKTFFDEKTCIDESDLIVITTEWPQFKTLPERCIGKTVLDLRRVVSTPYASNLRSVGIGTGESKI